MNKLNRRFEHSTNSQKKTNIDFKGIENWCSFSRRNPQGLHFFTPVSLQRSTCKGINPHQFAYQMQEYENKTHFTLQYIHVLCCLLFGDWLRLFEIPSVVIFVSVH